MASFSRDNICIINKAESFGKNGDFKNLGFRVETNKGIIEVIIYCKGKGGECCEKLEVQSSIDDINKLAGARLLEWAICKKDEIPPSIVDQFKLDRECSSKKLDYVVVKLVVSFEISEEEVYLMVGNFQTGKYAHLTRVSYITHLLSTYL